mgnify:CR=1 FL=1
MEKCDLNLTHTPNSHTGAEWHETVYDEDKDILEGPVDDGGRLKL